MADRVYTHWTMPELRRISARRLAGESWAAIADGYPVGESAIRCALKRHGLPYRYGYTSRQRRELVHEALELRGDGYTWDEVARLVGWRLTESALRHACARARGAE